MASGKHNGRNVQHIKKRRAHRMCGGGHGAFLGLAVIAVALILIFRTGMLDTKPGTVEALANGPGGSMTETSETAAPSPTPIPTATPAPRSTPEPTVEPVGVIYLTFDDGPTSATASILDVLAKYDVKATFFTVGDMILRNPGLLRREYDEGHAIGCHTQTHKMPEIYKDEESFRTDVEAWEATVNGVLGHDLDHKLFRFPGGSFSKEARKFRDVVEDMGYTFWDWSVDSRDSLYKVAAPIAKLRENIWQGSGNKREVILLFHDLPSKTTTVDVLPEVIEYFQGRGFVFRTLDQRVDENGHMMRYTSG